MSPMRLLRFHDGGSQDRMGYPQVVHFRLSLANCYFTRDSSGFPALLRFFDAQSGRSFHPFHRRPGSVARSWRGPFPRCGVASAQAPDPDLESLPETISEFTRVGPGPRWLDGALGASNSSAPFRNRSEAFDTAWPSQSLEQAKVPDAVLPGSPPSARDRKSTRLNSSHVEISYAVFCLKKKKNKE